MWVLAAVRKRAEILQLLLSGSSFALLDETDSGVDVDALKVLVRAIGSLRSPKFSALIVTHHKGILDSLVPDKVHLLKDGRIQKSGDIALANAIEADGYGNERAQVFDWFVQGEVWFFSRG